MKKLLLILLTCSLSASVFPLKKHVHHLEQTGSNSLNTIWVFKEKSKELYISGSNETSKTLMRCLPDFTLLYYQHEDSQENHEYTIERNKNILSVKGKIEGEALQKTYDIGKDNWVQNMIFGLQEFAKSKNSSYYFVKISPKDFDLIEMIAKKDDIESITIQNKTYKAQKIKITLTGMRSMFWSAYAWFDLQSSEFLKYQGNSGPGTDDTIITLKNQ